MMKRCFSLLLCLTLCLALLPLPARAAGYREGDIPGTTGTGTATDPVVCDTYFELRAALRRDDVSYVQLNSVTDTAGRIPADTTQGCAISIGDLSCNKTLILNGNATFTAAAPQSSGYAVNDFIRVQSGRTLTITGSGTITYVNHYVESYFSASVLRNWGTTNVGEGVAIIADLSPRQGTQSFAENRLGKAVSNMSGRMNLNGGAYDSNAFSCLEIAGGTVVIAHAVFNENRGATHGLLVNNEAIIAINSGYFYPGEERDSEGICIRNSDYGTKGDLYTNYSEYTVDGYGTEIIRERITAISVPGYNPILVGNTPNAGFAFDSSADAFQAQGLRLNYWEVTCTTTDTEIGKNDTFEKGKSYSVLVNVEVLPWYILDESCAFSFDGAATVDEDTSCVNAIRTSATIRSVAETAGFDAITSLSVPGWNPIYAGHTPANTVTIDDCLAQFAAAGVTPVEWKLFNDTERKSLGRDDVLVAGNEYSLYVKLKVKPGYLFAGGCSFDFCGKVDWDRSYFYLSEIEAGVWTVPVVCQNEPISSVTIPGYNTIMVGRTPADTFTFDDYAEELAAQGVRLTEWFCSDDTAGSRIEPDDVFEADRRYSVFVLLEPLENCSFSTACVPDFDGKVAWEQTYSQIDPDEAGFWTTSVESVDATDMQALTVSHSCTLNECLELNYYVNKSALSGYEDVRMVVRCEDYNGSVPSLSAPEGITPTVAKIGGTDRYRFAFRGIAAAEIGNRIYATIYATKNGVAYAFPAGTYSIAEYCYAVLDSSSMSDSLKTLCVDTLNYGAAAQVHFNVNPGNLCNADLTNAQKARSVGNVALQACNSTAAFSGTIRASFGGKSYVLNNAPELKLRIVPNAGVDASKLKVRYTYTRADGTTAGGMLMPEKDGDDWLVRLNTVAGPDLRSPISFAIFAGPKQASDTLTFSAEGYCYAMTNSATAKQTLKDLCSAMMRFSEAARRHFGGK